MESRIAVILAKLELEGKREKEERIEWEIRRREQEEIDRIETEIEEQKEAELKQFTDLFKEALQLHHAIILRNYIEQLHANSDSGDDWINWARNKVDWYDPLKNESDDILDNRHKSRTFNYFLTIK